MIINLVGPPAAGKSTFAAKYVLEHPEFKYCTIDAYRIKYKNEDTAWAKLFQDVLENKNIILESCGLSWRLVDIFNSEAVRRRHLYTVAFVGDIEEIKERLAERQKRPVPFPYDPLDEVAAVDYVSEHLDESIAPIDVQVNTTSISMIDQYRLLCRIIASERIKALSQKGRRKRTFQHPTYIGSLEDSCYAEV